MCQYFIFQTNFFSQFRIHPVGAVIKCMSLTLSIQPDTPNAANSTFSIQEFAGLSGKLILADCFFAAFNPKNNGKNKHGGWNRYSV
jgi:hypothetical protein